MSIPKRIHMVLLHWNEVIPPLFTKCERCIRETHPDWDVILWDDTASVEFVEKYFPEYLRAYQSFPYDVQRTDFLRLAFVYVFGGFYMDLDMVPILPLDGLLGHSLVLSEEKTIDKAEQQKLSLKYRVRIASYMFGGEAKHPFFRYVLDAMVLRSTIKVETQQEVLDVTGPGLLTDSYWETKKQFPDITLLRNAGHYCELPDGRIESCLFGKYAVHLHTGTWRRGLRIK